MKCYDCKFWTPRGNREKAIEGTCSELLNHIDVCLSHAEYAYSSEIGRTNETEVECVDTRPDFGCIKFEDRLTGVPLSRKIKENAR